MKKIIFLVLIIVFIGSGIFYFIYYKKNPEILNFQKNTYSDYVIEKCKNDSNFLSDVRSDSDCKNGKDFRCVDGWETEWYYDKRKTSKTEFSGFPSSAPEELKNATVGHYNSSSCSCKEPMNYEIINENKFEKTTCEQFFKFIEDYNASCDDCLLIWSSGCC
jgi:hypothetical protein